MRRAPDSPDFRAPDSVLAGAWAADSDEHLISAADELAEVAGEVDPAAGGALRLGQTIEFYLEAKAAEGLSPRSIEWYAMVLSRLRRDLGADRPIDAITAVELRAWLLSLRETLAPGSVLGYYRSSKAFGNWLVREGLGEARAFLALRRPRTPAKVIEPIPDDDLRRLLAVASLRDRAVVLLLVDTGLRVSEAAGIRLGDLRSDGTVKVMGKGAKERIVPVGPTARSALTRYLGERGSGSREEPLFLGRDGGLTTRGIHQLLGRLKRRSGVEARCNPHSLRHTFARAYLVNGGDVFSLQRILGHSTLDMVRRYVALADGDVAARHRTASPADRLLHTSAPSETQTSAASVAAARRGTRSVARSDHNTSGVSEDAFSTAPASNPMAERRTRTAAAAMPRRSEAPAGTPGSSGGVAGGRRDARRDADGPASGRPSQDGGRADRDGAARARDEVTPSGEPGARSLFALRFSSVRWTR